MTSATARPGWRLTESFDDKGVTGTAGVVGAVAFVPVAGFLMTGTSARVPMGAPVKAFMVEDVSVAFTGGPASIPLSVPTSAPPPQPQPRVNQVVATTPSK